MLYAGTAKPIPRNEWKEGAVKLPVESISEDDAVIKTPFSKPEVQYIGSTLGCGCNYPRMQFLGDGEWEPVRDLEPDAEWDTSERSNIEALVALLRSTMEETVELYGIWVGGGDFFEEPQSREDVSLERFLDTDFRFKEWGFYRVALKG
jgi:hypothetical protein